MKHAVQLAGRLIAAFTYAQFNGFLDNTRYIEKADAASQKSVHCDFICCVQDRRREPPGPQAIERQIETRETVVCRLVELQLPHLCKIQLPRRRADPPGPRKCISDRC